CAILFGSEARETLGSETARVHHAARWRCGCVAAHGVRAAAGEKPPSPHPMTGLYPSDRLGLRRAVRYWADRGRGRYDSAQTEVYCSIGGICCRIGFVLPRYCPGQKAAFRCRAAVTESGRYLRQGNPMLREGTTRLDEAKAKNLSPWFSPLPA